VERRRSEVKREKPYVSAPIISLSIHMSINLRGISLLFDKENAFFGFASAAENDQQGGSCGERIAMSNGDAVSALKPQSRDYFP
jgi:hypothetical protein